MFHPPLVKLYRLFFPGVKEGAATGTAHVSIPLGNEGLWLSLLFEMAHAAVLNITYRVNQLTGT
jgi:hypothetical protein